MLSINHSMVYSLGFLWYYVQHMVPLFKPGYMAFNAIAANSVMFPGIIGQVLLEKVMKMCENHRQFLYDTNTLHKKGIGIWFLIRRAG